METTKQDRLFATAIACLIWGLFVRLPAMLTLCAGIGALVWAGVGEYVGDRYALGAGIVAFVASVPAVLAVARLLGRKKTAAFVALQAAADAEREAGEDGSER